MTALKSDVTKDGRLPLILARDKSADGAFWYSVSSTGIYCRPSCPSRHALPANVTIHDTLEAARKTGARACKRCNPNGCSSDAENAAIIEQACRAIEQAEEVPKLAELAANAQLSPGYFHRLFKAVTGITPKAYASANRVKRLRAELDDGASVTDAIYASGYASSSRFYDQAHRQLGMTPTRYKAGGISEELRFAIGQCTLGAILVAMGVRGVAAILLGDDPELLVNDFQDRFPKALLVGGEAGFEAYVAQVIGLVETPGSGLDLPLDIQGTAFQQKVWKALRDIPIGTTASYADIARAIEMPKAMRAVAAACAANRHAVAIPCHRVVRSDGSLSGYRWGVERKEALLEREAAT